jgi:signal transduction histidine kinase
MNPLRGLAAIAGRSGRLPRRTVRLRLTGLYAMLFLASGAALLAITYTLVSHATAGCGFGSQNGATSVVCHRDDQPGGHPSPAAVEGAGGAITVTGLTPGQQRALASQQQAEASSWHAAEMDTLLTQSGIALAIMAAASIGLGWVVAGRALRPVRTITATARRISAASLNQRLALGGPDDEFKELGDTFDGLLARLEAAFRAQRQFIANASHELRTPLARQRLASQLALSDPDASIESLRNAHERVLASGAQQEQLIEALLTLARGQAGLDRHEPFDLAGVTGQILDSRRAEARYLGIDIRAAIRPAPLAGDPRLAERMVANLIDNALRHNEPGGWVDVTTGTRAGRAVLTVTNTGPAIPEAETGRLLRPFQRLGADRTGHGKGLGLGLSIVAGIAEAHHAALTLQPRPGGGLHVEATFPAPGTPPPDRPARNPGTRPPHDQCPAPSATRLSTTPTARSQPPTPG